MCMTYDEIAAMIRSMGLPCVYRHWDIGQAPSLPYLVYYYDARNDFCADNRAYQKIVSLTIELYSDEKDFDAEERVESVLQRRHLPYEKEETYISSEQMLEEIYELEIVLNGDAHEKQQYD